MPRLGIVERSCEALIEEAEAAPIEGWDFSWLNGRATEERPSWGYSRLLAERAKEVSSLLDLQTGVRVRVRVPSGVTKVSVAGLPPNQF